MKRLTPTEKRAIADRFFAGESCFEIGQDVGLYTVEVEAVIRWALKSKSEQERREEQECNDG